LKKRKSLVPEDKDDFIRIVLERYDQDLLDRADWSELRLQRFAKLFGWREAKNYPWPNASNQHVPMLMTNSLRTQDTLINAVLGSRPVISANAVNSGDAEKGKSIDSLQDYQFFTEQNGEEKIAAFAESFVNDGRAVFFVPWVREKRQARELRSVEIPEGIAKLDIIAVYRKTLEGMYPTGIVTEKGNGNYKVLLAKSLQDEDPETVEAEFFEEDGQHFVSIKKDKVIFDGPCPIPKPLEDIICPSRCDNLQPPSPSNPLGADHVIMVDWPQWDEIQRLKAKGYYDLLTDEDMESMEDRVEAGVGTDRGADGPNGPEQHKIQADSLAGQQYGNAKVTSKVFTRLTYFGRWKLPNNEFEEEIVARVILGPNRNTKALARLRYLEDEFPRQDLARPRPFASSPGFIPIPGQWFAIGMLELLEAMQDLTKILLDQMIDKHTLCNIPWGFYRSASGLRPEQIRIEPGVMHPVSDPQRDINYPQIPQNDQNIALNLIALVQQWSERESMQGALQMGGVPQGKASALRTSTNMMSVLQQGDARPERILRRFFKGIAELYQQMHELNKVFLPPKKQYRVTGVTQPGADPYQVINKPDDIGGMFQFDFKANALNTNKAITSQILSELLPVVVNGMTLQLGLTNPEKIYNLLRDLIQSKGQDEHKYLNTPPNADMPKLTAEEAMGQMVQGVLPQGYPSEGAQMHLQKLGQFKSDRRYGQLIQQDQFFKAIYEAYVMQVQGLVQQEMLQAQQAQQFAQAMGGGGGTGGPEGVVDPTAGQLPQAGPNQVMDESLPGAKGMVQ
jgi:hypothetical protein